MVLGGCRWFLGGNRWLQVVLGACRRFQAVLGGCRSFHLLVLMGTSAKPKLDDQRAKSSFTSVFFLAENRK